MVIGFVVCSSFCSAQHPCCGGSHEIIFKNYHITNICDGGDPGLSFMKTLRKNGLLAKCVGVNALNC